MAEGNTEVKIENSFKTSDGHAVRITQQDRSLLRILYFDSRTKLEIEDSISFGEPFSRYKSIEELITVFPNSALSQVTRLINASKILERIEFENENLWFECDLKNMNDYIKPTISCNLHMHNADKLKANSTAVLDFEITPDTYWQFRDAMNILTKPSLGDIASVLIDLGLIDFEDLSYTENVILIEA